MLEGIKPTGSVSHRQQCKTLPILHVSDLSSATIETLLKYVQRNWELTTCQTGLEAKLKAGSDKSCFQSGLQASSGHSIKLRTAGS